MNEPWFRNSYREDRAAFLAALERFAAASGRSLQLHTHALADWPELAVTVAELPARRPERLYLGVAGIHGLEGYAGSAILRALLQSGLAGLAPETTGIVLVHALNPYGFEHGIRVNAANVDLNRNCAAEDEPLFSRDNPAFSALRGLLGPTRPCSLALPERLRFYLGVGRAVARSSPSALRQASLSGQYEDPRGVFYGGKHVQPEIAFFQRIYTRLAQTYREVLLTDLHTGYGMRGQAYPLFGRADSPEFAAFTAGGVRDKRGGDKAYTVSGDLVGYCYQTSKRLRPDGVFNGTVVELGTHGLSIGAQLADLHAVVCENQLRHHGAVDDATAQRVRESFRELFCPRDPAWRRQVVDVGVATLKRLLEHRTG